MKLSQNEQILAHLKQHKSITKLEAMQSYGIFCLESIVFRLRKSGHNIFTEYEPNVTNTGTHARYEYLGGEQ